MKSLVRTAGIILLALKCSATFSATLRNDPSPTNQNLSQNYAVAGLFLNDQETNLTGASQVFPDAPAHNAYGITLASSHTEFAPQHVRYVESSSSSPDSLTFPASANSFARFVSTLLVDPGPGENIGDPVSMVLQMTFVGSGPNPLFDDSAVGEPIPYGVEGTLNALGTPIHMAQLGLGQPITVQGHIGDAVSLFITTGSGVNTLNGPPFFTGPGPFSADMVLDVTVTSVPEPSGVVLLAVGGLILSAWPTIKRRIVSAKA